MKVHAVNRVLMNSAGGAITFPLKIFEREVDAKDFQREQDADLEKIMGLYVVDAGRNPVAPLGVVLSRFFGIKQMANELHCYEVDSGSKLVTGAEALVESKRILV